MEERGKSGPKFKFEDPEELQKIVDQYFADCALNDKPYLFTGLALAMGVTRKCLFEYSKREGEIGNIIRLAKTKVESKLEEMIYHDGHHSGRIFSLKANFHWRDREESSSEDWGRIISEIIKSKD